MTGFSGFWEVEGLNAEEVDSVVRFKIDDGR
jgi:hypothetical protein